MWSPRADLGPKSGSGSCGYPRDDNTPLLLIFDGLDELTTKEEEAKRHAREILFQLRQMLTQMNTDGTEVRAMVLGRNVACQDALKAASLPLPIMLNVAPIIQMTRKTCLLNAPEKDDVEDFFDTAELCDLDQRETYWRTWAKLKGEAPDDIPKAITAKGMEELNAEPLLLHLLINSDYCKNSWEDAAENPNLVYEDILKKVYERNHLKDHFKSLDLTEADFLDLMECLGLAAWRGNGRTGDSEDFARVRELHLDKERQFEKIGAVDLDSVALNIHARRGVDGEGFEFIHKRFGEFLAVRGLVAHACRIADILIERDYPKNRTAEWIELLGPCAIKRELLPFLWREAMHVGSKNIDRTIARKDALTEFYNFVLANGFPISGRAKTFREEEGTQRRAEHALLAVASGLALSIPVQDAEEDEAPQHLLNVNFEGGSKSPHVMLNRLAAGPEGTGLANLARLKLAGADLIGASLYTANLREANLGRAHLNEADLEATELRGAFMSGAFMSGANLVRADLRGANLGGAYLSGANLFGANLRGANLCGANLSGALDLSLIAVNSAKGNAETKLPDYIDRSEVTWLQDDEADD
ncbi:MAG: pentapeptide repeat-containing protein [Pseudomonadota bacterium]